MGWVSWWFGRYSDCATEGYVSIPGRWKTIFLSCTNSSYRLWVSLSVLWLGSGAISSWENGRVRKVITHLKLLKRLRISEEISPLHHMSSMCAQGHIYLSFIVWLIYGWSFLQHAVPPFRSSTLLTKFKFYTCLQSCTVYWMGNRIS